jgi:hypothetical protein
VDLRGGQVRLILPLSHGRRASPGLQRRDGRRGNDGDLGRVGGGGGVERHRCRWTTVPGGEGSSAVFGGVEGDGEAGQAGQGVTRPKNRGASEVQRPEAPSGGPRDVLIPPFSWACHTA